MSNKFNLSLQIIWKQKTWPNFVYELIWGLHKFLGIVETYWKSESTSEKFFTHETFWRWSQLRILCIVLYCKVMAIQLFLLSKKMELLSFVCNLQISIDCVIDKQDVYMCVQSQASSADVYSRDITLTDLVSYPDSIQFNQFNQLSRCLISVSTDSKAHHPIRKA